MEWLSSTCSRTVDVSLCECFSIVTSILVSVLTIPQKFCLQSLKRYHSSSQSYLCQCDKQCKVLLYGALLTYICGFLRSTLPLQATIFRHHCNIGVVDKTSCIPVCTPVVLSLFYTCLHIFLFREEARELVEMGALNALFVLGRSMGFIGECPTHRSTLSLCDGFCILSNLPSFVWPVEA